MASNSIIDYMKNLGESVKFATTEHIKEQMPIAASFAEQNKETFNEVYRTVTNMRTLLPRLGRIEDNMLYKKANQAFNNIRTDISSGKFYHPEREDVMGQIGALSGLMSSMGGMGDDFMAELNAIFSGNFDDLDGAGEEGQTVEPTRPEMMVTKGDALVASALFKAQSTSTNCIGKLMTRLHENKNQMDRASFSMSMMQSQKQLSVMQAGFDLMTQGFNHIISFNNDVLKTHVDNSQKFYTAVSNTLNESNAILKSIHEIQSKVYKSEHSKGTAMDDNPIGNGQPIDFNTLFKNGFNIQAYKQLIDSRYKKSPVALMYAFVTNLPMMMQQYIDNPLHYLAKSIVGGVIGDQINYQLQKLDKTISDSFSTGLLKLYNYGKQHKDSMLGKVAQFFGFKQEETKLSQVDTSKFERGSMSWNGEAQKALTFVIPAHLSRIEAALTGSERTFDMKSGKFVNAGSAKNYEKNLRWDATKKSTEPINEFLTGMINNMNFASNKQGQDARQQIQRYSRSLREAIYDYGGIDSGTSQYLRDNFAKYRFKDAKHADMMANILDAIPPEVKNSITRKVSEAKIAKNNIISSDKNGSAIEYLIRGASEGMISNNKSGSISGSTNSNLPIWNTKLTELEDHRGNTVYDYLYMILQRLYQMGGIGGGTSGNSPGTTSSGIILPGGNSINVPPNIDDILKSTREGRISSINKANVNQNKKVFDMKELYEKVQQNAQKYKSASINYQQMLGDYAAFPIEDILASDLFDANQKENISKAYEQLMNAAAKEKDPFSSARINAKRKASTNAKRKGTSRGTDVEQIDMTDFAKMLENDESMQDLSKKLIRMAKEQNKNYFDTEMKSSSSMFDIFGGVARDTSKYHKLPENIKAEDSILSQLIAANDAGQVMDVVRHNIDALVDSPRLVMSSVIGKANEAVYDVLFGKNVGEVDSKGRPIKGIFQKMISEVDKQSKGIGASIKGFLKEVQKLFDSESDGPLSFIGDFFKKETGIDVANLGKNARERATGVIRGAGSEVVEALRSNGKTMKQYMHEAMHEFGLTDEKGNWNFGTTYANEKSAKAQREKDIEKAMREAEFSDEDSLISDNQTGVASGSRSFRGRGGIVSKGEMIVQPWRNPNYGKGTGIGSGISVVKNTGYLDASQLPAGSMVLNNRDSLNPFATGASLTSDLSKEQSVRSSMKNGITKRASLEEVPGYAKGKNNVARLQYLLEYSKNNTSNLNVNDLNRIIEAGLFKSKQEALLNTIIAEKDSRNEFGTDEQEKEQNKAKFARDFREAQRLVIKLMNAGDKGRDLRAKGFVQDSETGKIGVNDKAGVNFVKSMTTQEELGKRSYTSLAELRSYLESIGMGQFMPSDEDIGRKKFSGKQGPIIGIRQGILAATGTDPMKAVEMTKNYMIKEKKDIFSGATGGALLSMVLPLGGPLMGAVAGASFNLLRKSDTFNNYVFGTEIVKDGKKTGEREDNGLLSKKTQEILNKYVPDMKKFGVLGGVAGLITPFGPLGGAMIGAAASIVKNNASLHRMVFGKNGGLLNERRKEAIKKAFPHVAMATISSILLGPFGLMGNAVLGASLGFLSTSEMFKKLVLGTKGRDGVRRGGLAGVIRRQVVEPLQNTMKDAKEHLADWFKNKVFNPVAEGLKPLGRVMRGVISQSSKALFNKVEEFLTGKRGFLPEFITKYTDKVFGGIRKAGGIGQWITQSLVGKATEKLAGWTKKAGIGIENYAVSNGLVGGYSSKQLADVYQRTGEKSDRVSMINAMANLSDDDKLKLAESMQLLKSTREDAQSYYNNQQNEEANLLKNDILKFAEGVSGEQKNAIAQLNYDVNTDLFKKLMDIQNPEARRKFVEKFINNTDIDKRNRKILSNKILKSLEVYAGYESDKQEAESGNYLDKPLKLIAEKLGLEDLTPEQIKKIMDENNIYDITQNDKNSILDAREFAKAEAEAKEKKEGEAVEVTPEVESTDKNTESLDNLTLAINQLTERLQYINGEIGVEDLKYSGNINSAENINARNLVNAARVSMTRDAVNEGLANAPDRVETAYEQFSNGDVLGAAKKVGRDAASGVLNKYNAALSLPGDTASAFNKAVRDIYYGDKKLSIGGGLKGAASGAIAGGAADLALNSSIGGITGASALVNGAIKGSLQYTDKSSEFDKANNLSDDINHIKYILQHKDEFSEEEIKNAKRLWHAIKQMKKNLKGRKESEYNTGESLFDTVNKGRHIINKLPIIGKVQIGNTKPLYNDKIMKKIANASDDEIQTLLKKTYSFSDEYGDEVKELVEKSKEKFGMDDDSDTPGAAAGTRFFIPGFAEGTGGLGSLFSSMKDAALKGGKESASEHLKKTKESFKEHLTNINPFSSSKSGSDSISGAVAKPAFPIVPPGMLESGAAASDSKAHLDEQGRKVKEVTTSEGDVITYTESGQDGSWMRDNSKDNAKAEAKLEEKRTLARRTTNAIEAIAKKLGAMKDSAKETAKAGKGLFDDLLDFVKTPFKWLGGALSSAAGVLGGFLMTAILKPLKDGAVKLGKSVARFVSTQVSKLGSFFTRMIGRTASGIASGILSTLKKNRVIATILAGGSLFAGKKAYDAFNTDEGYKDEVEGFNSKNAGLGAMTPQEQKMAAEMAKQGQSEEAIAKALRVRRNKMASEGLKDEVKGDKLQEKKDLFNTFSGLGGTLIGGAIGKMKGKGMLGSIIGGTLGSAAGDYVAKGETPTVGGLALDAGMAFATNKVLSYAKNKITGAYRSGRDASHARTDRRERALERLRNIQRIRASREAANSGSGLLSKGWQFLKKNKKIAGLAALGGLAYNYFGGGSSDEEAMEPYEGYDDQTSFEEEDDIPQYAEGSESTENNLNVAEDMKNIYASNPAYLAAMGLGGAGLAAWTANNIRSSMPKDRKLTMPYKIGKKIGALINKGANTKLGGKITSKIMENPSKYLRGKAVLGTLALPLLSSIAMNSGMEVMKANADNREADLSKDNIMGGVIGGALGKGFIGKAAGSTIGGQVYKEMDGNEETHATAGDAVRDFAQNAAIVGVPAALAKLNSIRSGATTAQAIYNGFLPAKFRAAEGFLQGANIGQIVNKYGTEAQKLRYTQAVDKFTELKNSPLVGKLNELKTSALNNISNIAKTDSGRKLISETKAIAGVGANATASETMKGIVKTSAVEAAKGAKTAAVTNNIIDSAKAMSGENAEKIQKGTELSKRLTGVIDSIKNTAYTFIKNKFGAPGEAFIPKLEKVFGKIKEMINPKTCANLMPKFAASGFLRNLINFWSWTPLVMAGKFAWGFWDGWSETGAILKEAGLKDHKNPGLIAKILSGLVHALVFMIPYLGMLIPTTTILKICANTFSDEIKAAVGESEKAEDDGLSGKSDNESNKENEIADQTLDYTDNDISYLTNNGMTHEQAINELSKSEKYIKKYTASEIKDMKDTEEQKLVIKEKIKELLNKISSVLSKYLPTGVSDMVPALSTGISNVALTSNNLTNGLNKMQGNNKNSISSSIFNFNPDNSSISSAFIIGSNHSKDIFSINPSESTSEIKILSGLITSIKSNIPFLKWFLPNKEIDNVVVEVIGKALGITKNDLQTLKSKSSSIEKRNKLSSDRITEDKQKTSQGGKSKISESVTPTNTNNNTNIQKEVNTAKETKKPEDKQPKPEEEKSTWQSVKETASSAWEKTKSVASSAWESAKSTGSAIYNKFFGNGKYNTPAYGMGGLFMQNDPRYGDSNKMENCLSFAMANLDRYKYGGNSTPTEFMKEAEKTGDKVPNDGTKPEFTAKALSKRGYDVSYVNKDQVKDKMKDPNTSIIAEGTDSRGVNDKTPFAGKHYVAIDGMSKDGKKLSVMDSQTLNKSKNRDVYNSSELLNHTDKLIAITPKKGSSSVSKYARSKYGMGRSTPNDTPEIWKYMKSKGLSNVAIAGMLGNFQAESEMYSDRLEGHDLDKGSMDCPLDGHTGYGLAQWTYHTRQQALRDFAQSRGQQDGDWKTQIDFLLSGKDGDLTSIIKKMDESGSAEKAAIIFHDEYERSADDETRKQRRADNAKKFFDTEGKGINDGSSSLSGGSSSSGGSSESNKPLGFFGALSKLIAAFNPFTFDFSNPGQALSNAYNEFKSNVGGKVAGDSTSASKWADEAVGSTGFGRNGCTEFVKRYLQQAKSPLGDLMAKGEAQEDGHSLMWVPSLWKWAKKNNVFKEASQGGAQGDVALINTDNDPSDPDHVVIATGDGKYWGNSSSKNQIVKGDLAGDYGSSNIFGYVATGSGSGTVSTGEATRTKEEIVGDAGPTSGGKGKFGKGKFGTARMTLASAKKQLEEQQKEEEEETVDTDTTTTTEDDSDSTTETKTDDTKKDDKKDDEKKYTAPNGLRYYKNDIEYLTKNGYSEDAALEVLSKSEKYTKKVTQEEIDKSKKDAEKNKENSVKQAQSSSTSTTSTGNIFVDKLMGKVNQFLSNNPKFTQFMTFLFGKNPFADLFGSSGGSSGGAGASSSASGSVAPSEYAAKILEEARKHIGKPYSMAAGTGPNSYDCSGHAQTSYKAAGLDIPRTADYQYKFFKEKNAVVNIEQSQPGDLIFFENTYSTDTVDNNGITHVGVVSKSGNASTLEMIHASSSKGVIECGMSSWHQDHLPSGRPCIGSLSLAFGGAKKDDSKKDDSKSSSSDSSSTQGSGKYGKSKYKDELTNPDKYIPEIHARRAKPWTADENKLLRNTDGFVNSEYGKGLFDFGFMNSISNSITNAVGSIGSIFKPKKKKKSYAELIQTSKMYNNSITDFGLDSAKYDPNVSIPSEYIFNVEEDSDEVAYAKGQAQRAIRNGEDPKKAYEDALKFMKGIDGEEEQKPASAIDAIIEEGKPKKTKKSYAEIIQTSKMYNNGITNFGMESAKYDPSIVIPNEYLFNVEVDSDEVAYAKGCAQRAIRNGEDPKAAYKEALEFMKSLDGDSSSTHGKGKDPLFFINQGYSIDEAFEKATQMKHKKKSKKKASEILSNSELDKFLKIKDKAEEAAEDKVTSDKDEEKQTDTKSTKEKSKKLKSKLLAPNGEKYSKNDIQYLLNNGYSLKDALDLLSKDPKYAKKDDKKKSASDSINEATKKTSETKPKKKKKKTYEELIQTSKMYNNGITNFGLESAKYDPNITIPQEYIFNAEEDSDEVAYAKGCAQRAIRNGEDPKKAYDEAIKFMKGLSGEEDKKTDKESDTGVDSSSLKIIDDALKDIDKIFGPKDDKKKSNSIKQAQKDKDILDGKEIPDAPNGKKYSKNNIRFFMENGYTFEEAIDILSKDEKYTKKSASDSINEAKKKKKSKDDEEDILLAPNGEEYSVNDIQYLLDNGYSLEDAIDLLSKDEKYVKKEKKEEDEEKEDKKTKKKKKKSASDSINDAIDKIKEKKTKKKTTTDEDDDEKKKTSKKTKSTKQTKKDTKDEENDDIILTPDGEEYYIDDIQYLLDNGYDLRGAIDFLSEEPKYDTDEDKKSDTTKKKTKRNKKSTKKDKDTIDGNEIPDAPNGEKYSKNDIQYLMDNGYSFKDAIDLLSKDSKYTTKKDKKKKSASDSINASIKDKEIKDIIDSNEIPDSPNGEKYSKSDIRFFMESGYTFEEAIDLLSKDEKYAKKDDKKTDSKNPGVDSSSLKIINDAIKDADKIFDPKGDKKKSASDSINAAIKPKKKKKSYAELIQTSKMYNNGITDFGLESAKFDPNIVIPDEYIFNAEEDSDEVAYAKGCAQRAIRNGEDPKAAYEEALEFMKGLGGEEALEEEAKVIDTTNKDGKIDPTTDSSSLKIVDDAFKDADKIFAVAEQTSRRNKDIADGKKNTSVVKDDGSTSDEVTQPDETTKTDTIKSITKNIGENTNEKAVAGNFDTLVEAQNKTNELLSAILAVIKVAAENVGSASNGTKALAGPIKSILSTLGGGSGFGIGDKFLGNLGNRDNTKGDIGYIMTAMDTIVRR